MRFVWIGLSPEERIDVNIFKAHASGKMQQQFLAFVGKLFWLAIILRLSSLCCFTMMLSGFIRAIFLCIFSRERPFMVWSHVPRVVFLSNQYSRMWTVCHSTLFHCPLIDQSPRCILLRCCCQNANRSYFCDLVEKLEKNFFLRPTHHVRLWLHFVDWKVAFCDIIDVRTCLRQL